MSEVQQYRADVPMTSPLSAEENIGLTNSLTRRFRKQAFSVSGKIVIVIHPELVKSLGINEGTWIDEIETDSGVSIKICNSSELENIGTSHESKEVKHQES